MFFKHSRWKNVRQIEVRSNRLYRLQIDSPMALIGSGDSSRKELNELWHKRMGHLHHGALDMLRETVTGVPKLGTKPDDMCKRCVLGKYAKETFPRSDNKFFYLHF